MMSSIKGRCHLHKDASESFCTQHAVMCCPTCHQSANPDCAVMTTADARMHYERLIHSSSNSLDDAREQCGVDKNALEDVHHDIRCQSDADTDAVIGLCDSLRTVVDKFQQECMQKIQDQAGCLGNVVTKRIREMDDLDIFLSSLNGASSESDGATDFGISCRPSETHRQIVNNLIDLNTKSTQLKDAVSSAKGILNKDCKIDIDFTHSAISTNCQSSTDIVDRLKTELSALSKRLVITPEGASVPCVSGGADIPHIAAEANAAMTSDIPRARTFNKIHKCSYMGPDAVVCFIQSSPGHFLRSAIHPGILAKCDAIGNEMLRVKIDTSIYGMCVRDKQIFAVGKESFLHVYALGDLILSRKFVMGASASSIACLGQHFVISCPPPGNRTVHIISDYGWFKKSSARKFVHPGHIAVTPSEDSVLVSDSKANAIFILSTDLDIIKKLYVNNPNGVCFVGQSAYVTSKGFNCVLEISLDRKTQRMLLAPKDGIDSPFSISYHNERGHLLVSCQTEDKKILLCLR